jgi:hypothetical protein
MYRINELIDQRLAGCEGFTCGYALKYLSPAISKADMPPIRPAKNTLDKAELKSVQELTFESDIVTAVARNPATKALKARSAIPNAKLYGFFAIRVL